jgi:hypothetical protein
MAKPMKIDISPRFEQKRSRTRQTNFMRLSANLRASSIATVTILAVLLVPACGSICASMHHCSPSTTMSSSGDCHHITASSPSDSNDISPSSAMSCGQQSPLPAVLTDSESSAQQKSENSSSAFLASIVLLARAATTNAYTCPPSFAEKSPQHTVPADSISVLRI